VDEWLDRLAEALGEDLLTGEEVGAILKLAREVAHGVERKLAPASAYAIGVAVGRASARGADRREALRRAVATAATLIPEPSEEADG
jgi:uncharacterized protein DUF6457